VPRNTILLGDVLDQLRNLPAGSIDTIVTSPPYFLLRNYQAPGQLGAEETVAEYVANIVGVCDELARVLKPTGSMWLNLGDSFSRHAKYGASPKGLLLAPERVLLALADRGWIVRSKVVWSKPNPMPASVTDRLTSTWEPIYFLVRSRSYFFDLDAIRVPQRAGRGLTGPGRHAKSKSRAELQPGKYSGKAPAWAGPLAGSNDGLDRARAEGRAGHPLGKNPGDVWQVPNSGFRGAHFATFPTRLIERPLLATCPARVCVSCGRAWVQAKGVAVRADCDCRSSWRLGLVLDPFMGAGTTGVVAKGLGRDWLGIELNAGYRALALSRIAASGGAGSTKERR
jgi:site-specific DNA-methyltransferase (adenine-specific)